MDRLILMVGTLSAVAGVWFLTRSAGYYHLPLWERPDNPLHGALRPSGSLGHPFAWVGAGLMLSGVFLYSTRKRLGVMRGRGPMRTWLNLHIYLCLSGPFRWPRTRRGNSGGSWSTRSGRWWSWP